MNTNREIENGTIQLKNEIDFLKERLDNMKLENLTLKK